MPQLGSRKNNACEGGAARSVSPSLRSTASPRASTAVNQREPNVREGDAARSVSPSLRGTASPRASIAVRQSDQTFREGGAARSVSPSLRGTVSPRASTRVRQSVPNVREADAARSVSPSLRGTVSPRASTGVRQSEPIAKRGKRRSNSEDNVCRASAETKNSTLLNSKAVRDRLLRTTSAAGPEKARNSCDVALVSKCGAGYANSPQRKKSSDVASCVFTRDRSNSPSAIRSIELDNWNATPVQIRGSVARTAGSLGHGMGSGPKEAVVGNRHRTTTEKPNESSKPLASRNVNMSAVSPSTNASLPSSSISRRRVLTKSFAKNIPPSTPVQPRSNSVRLSDGAKNAKRQSSNLGRTKPQRISDKQSWTRDRCLKRLQSYGFSKDAALVALHATAGDERRAFELCKKGLQQSSNLKQEENPEARVKTAPPQVLRTNACYICGTNDLTQWSLEFHRRCCRRRWEVEEAQWKPSDRRPLLEEADLPSGFDCLEKYYESTEAFTHKARPATKKMSIEDWLAAHPQFDVRNQETEPKQKQDTRPSIASAPDRCKHDKAGSGSGTVALARMERCPFCPRSFAANLLQGHLKQCPGVAEKKAKERRMREEEQWQQRRNNVPCRSGASAIPEEVASSIDALQSSAALLAAGLIRPAVKSDEEKLRAEVVASVKDAEFVAAFKVSAAQRQVYDALRATMQKRDPGGDRPVERDLWHGTSWANIAKILQQGFNRSFAGKHGTRLGVATYFSTTLGYSHRFCDLAGGGKDGTKVMILARVLTGRHCRGKASDVEPPLIDADRELRYDSTVDDEEHPKMFAIFRDFQALPLFLAEFRS